MNQTNDHSLLSKSTTRCRIYKHLQYSHASAMIVVIAWASCFTVALSAQQSPQISIPFADVVATDSLGREIILPEAAGAPREGKYVGLFYYIWHGQHMNDAREVWDLTKMIKANPENPSFGAPKGFHWWGEPEEGYFRAEDPWYIRRNLQMIAQAGIDFIYFDTTNAIAYPKVVHEICRVSQAMRAQGINTPYLSFMTNAASGRTLNKIYDQFYTKDRYKDLWFIWEGKPLVFGQSQDKALRSEVRSFFNIKYSWAWTNAGNEPDHWQWVDHAPQDYGWTGDKQNVVQVPVAKASHPTLFIGGSYTKGQQPPVDRYKLTEFTGQGLFFQEQWQRVHELDPQVVMLTQWNEWLAQRQTCGRSGDSKFLGEKMKQGDPYFVDVYNQEFNRDICPMKGGHTDNHYYLMVNHIRKFKGIAARQRAERPTAIKIDGEFSDWQNVTPVFHDFPGDTMHRDFLRVDNKARYTNTTGRNDIVAARVATKGSAISFYVETAAPLTSHTGTHWMLLFINADQNKSTGWEGFDFACNLAVKSDRKTTLSAWREGKWKQVEEIDYRYVGDKLELSIPLAKLKLDTSKPLALDFQWADNIQSLGDISEFFLNGDVAPDRRFNYRYETAFCP